MTTTTRKIKPRTIWTPELIAQLRDLYPHQQTEAVAAQLGVDKFAAYNKAAALGIKKSSAFLASELSGRAERGKTHPAIAKNRFQKGMTPWNKGRSYQAGGRAKETQFKPGSKPHTWLPIGTYRVVTTKGRSYLEQKTNDNPGNANVRWISVMRLVWQAHHGDIPAGHIVVFKDPAQHTTVLEEITIDKLEMIHRSAHAIRNNPHQKNPELGKLVQLKGVIQRQINRIAKEQQQGQTP
jgi:hypothetical protein